MALGDGLLQTFGSYAELARKSAESLALSEVGSAYATRSAYYSMLEAYYSNEIYERSDRENASIANWPGLPKTIRPISMFARIAVDFWVGQVYGGSWTADGLNSSTGEPNRLAFDVETPAALRLAVQQAFEWGNAPKFLSRTVLTGAKLGECLAEVELHLTREPGGDKVYPRLIHPRNVVRLELSPRGDVRSYRLAVQKQDGPNGERYLWGKEVTADFTRTYKNDEPYGYDGQPALVKNPYGFVPAVWYTHQTTSGWHGGAAIDGAIPTIDEYQGVLSSINDFIHRFIEQGIAIESDQPERVKELLSKVSKRRPGIPSGAQEAIDARQSMKVLPLPAGSKIARMIENLGLGDAESHVARLKSELEQAFPEIILQEKLLEMQDVSAPGAQPLVQRAQQKLNDVCSNYDLQTIKLGQMMVAIAGYHIDRGDWGLPSGLTKAQQKFQAFDLDSYAAGRLAFSLTPRQLVPPTQAQRIANAQQFESITTAWGLEMAGFSPEDIYGKGNVPKVKPGILEERRQNAAVAGAALGGALQNAFNAGQVGELGQVPTAAEDAAPGGTQGATAVVA
jgi:hypothetical protein